ncbi:MAG: T9SS type B sorting domain-containing protein [Saprospiraceae bacterium]|nr:T9SS type B sorting domain-containing protein [Candidatus Vicinibacter affinis]MBP6523128.1 T9SS type B sorting domain-containing protein [Saprospiraceae bacterium]MBK7696476.1 T9SS type B sorting domain-containing protein [Candidatus Vicinibacter affinis]MBK7800561.1 T9SS type B sorting domain-containing protein [Candidatus Vicinibacter affinis]MBK8644173.1 T9SS type B sorting domain-containing protein [Candidatus Vicinibacter affinis]
MKHCIIGLLMVIFGLPSVSQKLYFLAQDSQAHQNDIFELDINSCTYALWCDDIPSHDYYIRPFPQKYYFLTTINAVITWELLDSCHQGTKIESWIQPSIPRQIGYSRESDKDGIIWLFDDLGVGKVNPPSLYFAYQNYADLNLFKFDTKATIYNGKIYTTGTEINDPLNKISIFEIDTSTLKVIRKIRTFENYETTPGSLFPLNISCGVSHLICTIHNKLYYLDINSGNLSLMCDVQLNAPNTFISNGASPWPYNPNDCDVFIDLDLDGNSGDKTNGFNKFLKCRQNKSLITDADLDVFSDFGSMDSLNVELLNTVDNNFERLSLDTFGNFKAISSNTFVRIFPSGFTSNKDYELALKNIYYVNDACPVSPGLRKIRFIAYKNGKTDTAICNLNIIGPYFNAGSNNQISICKIDTVINLSSFLGTCFSSNGIWSNSTGILNPSKDTSGIYSYTVGDSICGIDASFIKVDLLDLPAFDLGSDQYICPGDSVSFEVPALFTVEWQDKNTTPKYVVTNPGIYKVRITNNKGCFIYDSIQVFQNNYTTLTNSKSICQNQNFIYKNISYPPGSLIRDTLYAASGCDTLLELWLKPLPLPAVSILGDTLLCEGDTALLSTSASGSLLWSTGDITRAIPAAPGNYSLTVTDANNCSASSSFRVDQAPPISYVITSYDPLCSDELGSVLLKVSSGGIPPIQYSLNGLTNPSGIFSSLPPGSYIATFSDALGCTRSDTVLILSPPLFEVDMTDSLILDAGSSVLVQYRLLKGSIQNILFQPGEGIALDQGGLRISATTDQIYTLTFIDDNGCEITKTLKVSVRQNNEFFAPLIFSPNNDGINDFWLPSWGSSWTRAEIKIYDRWGALMASPPATQGWDGNHHGMPCIPGVYLFHIVLYDAQGTSTSFSGDLTLVR